MTNDLASPVSIRQDIDDLLAKEIIDSPTAARLREHYSSSVGIQNNDRQLTVFGLLGSLLVGLGVILIVAHNWDDLSINMRIFFACLPLFIGQVACGLAVFKFPERAAWREGASVFVILAIGACIAMVSQVYNIEGALGEFLLSWVAVSIPVIYVMKSRSAAMLVLAGATWHGVEVGYMHWRSVEFNAYPIFLAALIPAWIYLFRKAPQSNAVGIFSYLIPLSLLIMLPEYMSKNEMLFVPCYLALASIFYLIGVSPLMSGRRLRSNGFVVIGSLTTVTTLLIGTFLFYWEELGEDVTRTGLIDESAILLVVLSVSALVLFIRHRSRSSRAEMRPVEPVFILFLPLLFIGMYSSIVVWLVNILVLAVGLLTIREGLRKDHLGILNYGLLILLALVLCRFFDEDLSFVIRGLLFIAVGVGFFVANIRLIRQRRSAS